jgi:hypothetical protein
VFVNFTVLFVTSRGAQTIKNLNKPFTIRCGNFRNPRSTDETSSILVEIRDGTKAKFSILEGLTLTMQSIPVFSGLNVSSTSLFVGAYTSFIFTVTPSIDIF